VPELADGTRLPEPQAQAAPTGRAPHGPRQSIRSRLKRHGFQLVVIVASVLIAEAAHRTVAIETAEHLYSDLWHRLAGVRFTPEHVAVVVVDDAALAEHADDPMVFWTPLFARAAARLRDVGASVIGIDFLFALTPEDWINRQNLGGTNGLRDYDLTFRQELNTGHVVLVASLVRGKPGEQDGLLLPHSDYLLSLPSTDFSSYIAFADLLTDEDGGVRRFVVSPSANLPAELRAGAPRFTLGALLAARAASVDPAAPSWRIAGRVTPMDEASTISFAGPPGTIPRVSLSRILAPDAAHDPSVQGLRGKVVIVGADFQGMNDVHATPYSGRLFAASRGLMAGAEIQANVVETLMSGRGTNEISEVQRWLLLCALIALTTWVYGGRSPWTGLIVLAGACALTLAISFAGFERLRLVPAAELQLGLVTAYLLAYSERLTSEQREKARVKKMFQGYVSDDVVDMLLSSEKKLDLHGESTHITVLFSDIRDFTTLSEKLSAHETVEFLNAYFTKVVAIIVEEGGRIDKFIGDAVMAEFGVPYMFPDHAYRALRAAVRMRAVAGEFAVWMRERFPDRDIPPFAIGIGVHTGNAVVGNVGSQTRMEYTAIGDTVNVASRLEGKTKDLKCVIAASAQVVREAGDKVQTGTRDRISVKGRLEQVEVYEIIDVRS
jgi:adenylate cyclase